MKTKAARIAATALILLLMALALPLIRLVGSGGTRSAVDGRAWDKTRKEKRVKT